MIAVGSDRYGDLVPPYIDGFESLLPRSLFVKKQAHLFIQLHTIFVSQKGKVSWHTHR